MFVPCPHCQFLVAHHPQLRPLPDDCPRCGGRLQDSDEPVVDHTPPSPASADSMQVEADAGSSPPIAGPKADAQAHDLPASVPDAIVDMAGEPIPADGGRDVGIIMPVPDASPRRWPRPHDITRWRWPLVATLGLLLVLQALLADRDRLATDPRWRPLMENLCGALKCTLQPWREPSAFLMLDRQVRAGAPGTLRVDATFRNDARWAQPWPALQLSLDDADGRVLGSGIFAPADYLGAAPTTLLSPGQTAQITFVVQEPAPGTTAFSFQLR